VGIRRRPLESLVTSGSWAGRRVFVTGHTGFKGGWLTMWLHRLGALVHGFALEPPTRPSLFEVAGIDRFLASDTRADLLQLDAVVAAMRSSQPGTVLHLAAQPLVRDGYARPIETIRTNTLGTAHVLEAVRHTPSVRAVVIVSTDKVYAAGQGQPHVEGDPLGGDDPYSASKAAAEVVAASYRVSFLSGPTGHPARVATARAGNVIGGGDWATDRLVPDCIRAFESEVPALLRYPDSVRPWQHVLEPLDGYIRLAERLAGADGDRYATAWNFGPDPGSDMTALDLANTLAAHWGRDARVEVDDADHPPETAVLRLDAAKSRSELGWRPRWALDRAVRATLDWHRAHAAGADMRRVSDAQIEDFESGADADTA
jgi:CDP-glucose 4,6-dehydratase